jgi:hypothetical protein
VNGRVLLMVVPHGQLQECVPLLSEAFTQVNVFRLSDPESERFDQVVLLAVRTRVTAAAYEANRQKLIETIWKHPLPVLSGAETPYQVPPSPHLEVGCRKRCERRLYVEYQHRIAVAIERCTPIQ